MRSFDLPRTHLYSGGGAFVSDPEPTAGLVPANQPLTPSLQPPHAVGPVIPVAPALNKRTYASPLSFLGATRRVLAWVRRVSTSRARFAFAWIGAILFLLLAYAFLICWYLVIFAVFGLFTIPYRLVRRSQRKALHLQQVQLATMQQMMVNQQEAMIRNERNR